MPDQSPNHDDRLQRVEAEVRRLHELADLAAEREPRLGDHRNPRLAKTVEKSGGSYPAASSTPNTYWIVFQDGTFTETEGDQTPSYTARQDDGKALAHFPDGTTYNYLPEGTIVIVLWDNGRWWIVGLISPANILWARVQAYDSGASPTNANANAITSVAFRVKSIDKPMGTESGDAFTLSCSPRPNRATALFDGDDVGYVLDAVDKYPWVVTDAYDDPMDSMRLVADASAIVDGWEADAATYDKFIMGSGDTYNIGNTGGQKEHRHCINEGAFAVQEGTGATCHTQTNLQTHIPPFVAYAWIRRTS